MFLIWAFYAMMKTGIAEKGTNRFMGKDIEIAKKIDDLLPSGAIFPFLNFRYIPKETHKCLWNFCCIPCTV